MQVVCDRNCALRNKSNFCTKEFLFINQMGACSQFYNDDGTPRRVPLFVAEREADEWFKQHGKEVENDNKTEEPQE